MLTILTDPLGPGDHTRFVESRDGRLRSYLIHIPARYDATTPAPVVLAFHGGGSNGEQMVRFSGLNETADRQGFIAVYPNGTGSKSAALSWNGGNCCGFAMENQVDDVAFVSGLLDDLEKVVRIDSGRVHAAGMSNGGVMTYRLASELSGRIAAIAAVGGPMGTLTCSPKRPVSVIHFHGSADEFVPLQGGVGAKSLARIDFHSVDHSIKAWIQANGCGATPSVTHVPDTVQDGTSVSIQTYGPGKDDAEVVLVLIEGGGHTWPGRQPPLGMLGKSTMNIAANDMIWPFFEKHAMK